ncbi:hypothetical protein E6C76_08670 [Pseudothauera nasutitermitis]|uniref:Uncharacterized protein n=1 Tax=Pseudothauera nasutitermitis TaxID=2565930 RepID=A0A4S4AZM9_9RHOO|nr:hypothetical protein [Pseudothauera nasutitermitis]THF65633.1 hypothetical protein E6C76_08670 [Pseudothauera nasutitermitis]
MSDFIHDGKRLRFWPVTGEVIGSSKHSQTQVYGGGGGGYLHQGTGYLSGGQISSSSVTCHEFWLRLDDGTEMPVSLRGVDIPLRAGQRITLIAGGPANVDEGQYCILVNHSANRYWFIYGAKGLNERYGIEVAKGRTIGLMLLYAFSLIVLDGMLGLNDWFSQSFNNDQQTLIVLGGLLAYPIYRHIRRKVRTGRLVRRLEAHLRNLALQAFGQA